jgi:hypothetical protein
MQMSDGTTVNSSQPSGFGGVGAYEHAIGFRYTDRRRTLPEMRKMEQTIVETMRQ